MPADPNVTVAIPPALRQFVEDCIASGRYQNATEVVLQSLKLLVAYEAEQAEALDGLKSKLRRGAAQAERGELIDGEVYLDRLIGKLEQRLRKPGAA